MIRLMLITSIATSLVLGSIGAMSLSSSAAEAPDRAARGAPAGTLELAPVVKNRLPRGGSATAAFEDTLVRMWVARGAMDVD